MAMAREQKEMEKVYDCMTHPSSWAEGEELKYKYVVIPSLVAK
jgi:hypothetical protein